MREIKFRAWTGSIMIYDAVSIKYSAQQMAGDIPLGHYYSPSFCSSHMGEIMQYTGLKDSKGVEIYEGDIIHDTCGNYEVRWSGSRLSWIVADDDTEYYDNLSKQGELEVIGNIYENHELLENKC